MSKPATSRASVALTGAPQTFCQRPDLVAKNEEYAWGAGLFFWMENVKNDKTCHQSVLVDEDFGMTLDSESLRFCVSPLHTALTPLVH